MICERAEALLSAFHDGELDPGEYGEVENHLRECQRCAAILDEIDWGDQLLMHLPRVQPSPDLRARIFNSPEFQKILAEAEAIQYGQDLHAPSVSSSEEAAPIRGVLRRSRSLSIPRRSARWPEHALQVAAIVVLVLGATLLARVLTSRPAAFHRPTGTVPVPAGPVQGPLPEGVRFIYNYAGQLWSHPAAPDGISMPLTPATATVAGGWAVSPAHYNTAGDRIAYIDQASGALHVVQADSQNDRVIVPQIAHPGTHPQSFWASAEGQAILHGLAWSPNGQRLAFIGDPAGSGSTALYVVNADGTGLMRINENSGGITQSPVWSPLGVRIAYEQISEGVTSIWEYNFVVRETLEVAQQANSDGPAGDVVRMLAWSSDAEHPTLTWSTGPANRQSIDSLWARRVGVSDGVDIPLIQGSLRFASYSAAPSGGAWIYASAGGLDEITIAGSTAMLDSDPAIVSAVWSPDGTGIAYIDAQGSLQVRTLTGARIGLAQNATATVAPAWSPNGRQVAFVAHGRLLIIPATGGKAQTIATLSSDVTMLSWSPDSSTLVATGAGDIIVASVSGSTGRVPAVRGVEWVAWTEIA
jgi:Tol biopolymer transport system component